MAASVITKAERGGHLRMNHATALGHAGDVHHAGAQRHLAEGHLRHLIGGEDGARGVREAVLGQAVEQTRQGIDDELGVQFDADHAGGSGQHFGHRRLQHPRHRAAGGQRGPAAGAGRAIGVAGVHQDGAGDAARRSQVLSRQQHRRGLHAVAGEHRRRRGRRLREDQGQVVLLLFPDARVGGSVTIANRKFHWLISQHFILPYLIAVEEIRRGHAPFPFDLKLQKLERRAGRRMQTAAP